MVSRASFVFWFIVVIGNTGCSSGLEGKNRSAGGDGEAQVLKTSDGVLSVEYDLPQAVHSIVNPVQEFEDSIQFTETRKGEIRLDVEVFETGTFALSVLAQALNSNSNTVRVSFGDRSLADWDLQMGSGFQWTEFNDKFELERGRHELVVHGKEAGVRIQKLRLHALEGSLTAQEEDAPPPPQDEDADPINPPSDEGPSESGALEIRLPGGATQILGDVLTTEAGVSFLRERNGTIHVLLNVSEAADYRLQVKALTPEASGREIRITFGNRSLADFPLTSVNEEWSTFPDTFELSAGAHQLILHGKDVGVGVAGVRLKKLGSGTDETPSPPPEEPDEDTPMEEPGEDEDSVGNPPVGPGSGAEMPARTGEVHYVTGLDQLHQAAKVAKPGDHIVIRNGDYENWHMRLDLKGLPDQPIVVRAEEAGRVRLQGSSYLVVKGEHVILWGLFFEGGSLDGEAGEVISIGDDHSNPCNSCALLNSKISNVKNNEESKWVSLYGQYIEVAYSTFVGKRNRGTLLTVWREPGKADHAHIHHNYFADRPSPGEDLNGYEILRIGTSTDSQSSSYSLVEYNLFERCDGEIEIISNKSGHNTFRFNTFRNNVGMLTLRHGTHAVVEGNYFIGEGKSGSAGIRLIDQDHLVFSNHMEGLSGDESFRMPLVLMRARENPALNSYWKVEHSKVGMNAVIDNKTTVGVGTVKSSDPVLPEQNVLAYNIVRGNTRGVLNDAKEKNRFIGNLYDAGSVSETGWSPQVITTENWNGIKKPTNAALSALSVTDEKLNAMGLSEAQKARLTIRSGSLYDHAQPLKASDVGAGF